MRLERDFHIMKILLLQQAHMLQCRFYESFRRDAAVLCQKALVQRACIDADADRYAARLRRLSDAAHVLRSADIAGIEPERVNALLDGLKRQAIVKMDVGDERHRRLCLDPADVRRRFLVGYGEAHDVAACSRERLDLANCRLCILRLRIRHGLHGDGSAAADGNCADMDLPRDLPLHGLPFFFQQKYQPPTKMRMMSFFVA